MASFRETRNALLVSYVDGLISEEEFVLLCEENTSNNLDFPYDEYPRFVLEDKDEAECIADFRVEKHHIPVLADALQLPDVFRYDQGTVCMGKEGLCVLLKRFAYPCRYSDMVPIFGRPVSEISMIGNTVMDWMFDTHKHRILEWNHNILNPLKLERYADAIFDKGAPLSNCFGFIDGTVRPISRPGENQRVVYNGHKRLHGLKFQSVTLPNGLIGHLYGPIGKKC